MCVGTRCHNAMTAILKTLFFVLLFSFFYTKSCSRLDSQNIETIVCEMCVTEFVPLFSLTPLFRPLFRL